MEDPALCVRRMSGGPTAEKRPTQKFIMLCTSLGFIALLVVSAVDYRFRWTAVPLGGVVIGDVLVAIGFYLISLVYRENTYTCPATPNTNNRSGIALCRSCGSSARPCLHPERYASEPRTHLAHERRFVVRLSDSEVVCCRDQP
jgi:hypothetical protein